jgi:methionyl-tRNA formyltransferase
MTCGCAGIQGVLVATGWQTAEPGAALAQTQIAINEGDIAGTLHDNLAHGIAE